MNKQNYVAVIPAWNEEPTIGLVLDVLVKLGIDFLVVDDGSTDATVEIARKFGAIIVQHKKNQGYESSLSTGVQKASEEGYKYAITCDADGQIDPRDVIKFVEIAEKDKADVVVGIRSYRNRFCERFLCYYGKSRFKINDPLCGIKLYNLEKAKDYFPFDSKKLVGMELALKMSDGGERISQADIKINMRRGESRYGASLSGELKILKSLLKTISIFGLTKK